MGVCHVCGDLGKDGGCSRCGLTPRAHVSVKSVQLDMPVDLIPISYQGKIWEKPVATKDTPLRFAEFDSKLERVLKEFLAGRIPPFSMFIGAPAKYGKHSFAYSCLQTAAVQRYTIAPLFSVSDWRRLYRVSQMNPFYKLYETYTWDNLITRDVVFMYVDHSEERYDCLSMMRDILDTRAGFGKPTFIVSDFNLTDLVPRWGDTSYTDIYNPDPSRDMRRYPVVLNRFQ